MGRTRGSAAGLWLGLFLAIGTVGAAHAAEDGNWPTIREMLFEDRAILDGGDRLAMEAPRRALDAAMVPIAVSLLPAGRSADDPIRTLWLVIDNNPAPVAAVFHLAPEFGIGRLETRIRVNAYTPVRAIAETANGRLLMVERFVKAAGGCSAPGLKDREVAMARLGKMKFALLDTFAPGGPQRVKLKIGHPNYTGLQIDQLTRNWIPPDYVTEIDIRFDGRPLLSVDGDISLSEDPTLVFDFLPPGEGRIEVVVEDSSGRRFEKGWRIGPTS